MRPAPHVAGVRLRRAQLADAPELRAILHDTFESTWRPNITTAAADAFLSEDRPSAYIRARGLEFRVAERDGEVVGLVHWEADFVNALHVLASYARSGIGAALMDEAEAEIASAGFASARLETDTSTPAAKPSMRRAATSRRAATRTPSGTAA